MEEAPAYDKDLIGYSGEDVRKEEKELMSYDRDMATAAKARGGRGGGARGGGRGPSRGVTRSVKDGWNKEDDGRRSAKRGRGGAPRGDRGGDRKPMLCYRQVLLVKLTVRIR